MKKKNFCELEFPSPIKLIEIPENLLEKKDKKLDNFNEYSSNFWKVIVINATITFNDLNKFLDKLTKNYNISKTNVMFIINKFDINLELYKKDLKQITNYIYSLCPHYVFYASFKDNYNVENIKNKFVQIIKENNILEVFTGTKKILNDENKVVTKFSIDINFFENFKKNKRKS